MFISKAAELIRESNYTVVLSGAGISTSSGIPDFRSTTGGLWQHFNPMEVASLSVFRTNPQKFFNWFRPMAKTIFEAKPNSAHFAIAKLEKLGFINEIITQNIDILHQKANSQEVHEVHGTISTMTCTSCFQKHQAKDYIREYIENSTIPLCSQCNQILKPDVILFEEQLPKIIWEKAANAINKCDLLIVVGSSLEVSPVSNLPYKAISKGAKLIINNHSPTYLDERADLLIRGDLADTLPSIEKELSK